MLARAERGVGAGGGRSAPDEPGDGVGRLADLGLPLLVAGPGRLDDAVAERNRLIDEIADMTGLHPRKVEETLAVSSPTDEKAGVVRPAQRLAAAAQPAGAAGLTRSPVCGSGSPSAGARLAKPAARCGLLPAPGSTWSARTR